MNSSLSSAHEDSCLAEDTSVSSSTMTTTSLPTQHVAICIVPTQPTRAALACIQECIRRFPAHQVYVVGYGQSDDRTMLRALHKYGLSTVQYTFRRACTNPRQALHQVCRVKLFMYTHVLLVDPAAGHFPHALQDVLYGSNAHNDNDTDNWIRSSHHDDKEPPAQAFLCGYFGHAVNDPLAQSTQPKRFWSRCRNKNNVRPRVVVGRNHKSKSRWMDLWERTALVAFLDGSRKTTTKQPSLVRSVGSLTQAMQQSCTSIHANTILYSSHCQLSTETSRAVANKVIMYE